MRARFEKLAGLEGCRSFFCYEVDVPYFDFFWHFHPEYELTCILNGRGKRLVGDSIEYFKEGDLVLIGPMLPHVWLSDKNKKQECRAIVIQFSKSFVAPFLELAEFAGLKILLENSGKGLAFSGNTDDEAGQKIRELSKAEGMESVTGLFQLLASLTRIKPRHLSSDYYRTINKTRDDGRMNQVLEFVQRSFTQKLSASHAASEFHLSESAFCKFFKRNMGKTFSDYVNGLRVAKACRMLLETDQPVSHIATACGFENLAYFNRVFLEKQKLQPSRYRMARYGKW